MRICWPIVAYSFGCAALAVCTTGCSASSCSIAGPAWPDHIEPLIPSQDGRPLHIQLRVSGANKVELNSAGFWGGEGRWRQIDFGELRRVLRITDTFSPQLYLVVDVSPGTSCDFVETLAAELESLPMCRNGLCLERSAWENYSDAMTN